MYDISFYFKKLQNNQITSNLEECLFELVDLLRIFIWKGELNRLSEGEGCSVNRITKSQGATLLKVRARRPA
jgi:hypothetical protein